MRILVEHGGHALLNMGDLAMLQVALKRLYDQWPDARVQVLTDSAERLSRYCPGAEPLLTDGRDLYGGDGKMLWPFGWRGRRMERWLLVNHPEIVLWILDRRGKSLGIDMRPAHAYVDAIRSADLVISAGGGYLTDVFPWVLDHIYRTLMLAMHFGKSTALVGQGLGPLNDRMLRRMAADLLRGTRVIGLREQIAGFPILADLQVPMEKVIVTGDEAIEPAYALRPSALGNAIGVNLRIADYADVDEQAIERLKTTLHEAADKHDAPLAPLYVSFYANDQDSRAIDRIVEGREPDCPADSDTGQGGDPVPTPTQLIECIGKCRVVVTGSYHGAVFALSQGIPAIGIAKSKYYEDKFIGLAEQFGTGCRIALLTKPDFQATLARHIDEAWASAEENRPELLRRAAEQIKQGTAAYERIAGLTSQPPHSRPPENFVPSTM